MTACFLDVHMPGVTGVEAARHIGHRAHLVFVTAYDQYAVQAFAQGVLDYLVKPVDAARLAQTAARLQERLRTAMSAVNTEVLLQQLAATLERQTASAPLRWIRASVGQTVTLIPVQDIDFLRAEEKYTAVAWHETGGTLRGNRRCSSEGPRRGAAGEPQLPAFISPDVIHFGGPSAVSRRAERGRGSGRLSEVRLRRTQSRSNASWQLGSSCH